MSTAFNLALEYSGDRRLLRDYFYEACKCTHYWTGPMSSEKGPPDAQAREHYAAHNNYNLIDLRDLVDSSASYRADVRVTFTFNKGASPFIWSADVLDASVRWLARSPGDAFLDMDAGPVLGRKGVGLIRIDEYWANGWSRDKQFIEKDLPVVMHALKREGLAYERGTVEPYYM